MTREQSSTKWTIDDRRSPARLTDASGETIALIYLTDKETRKRDAAHAANAALIAAAPELIAALENLLSVWDLDRRHDAFPAMDARAAIAKAKGEA